MFLGTGFFVENHAKKGEINLMKRTKFHTDNTKAIKWALLQACEKAILHSNLYAVYITESKVGKVIFNLINYKCLQHLFRLTTVEVRIWIKCAERMEMHLIDGNPQSSWSIDECHFTFNVKPLDLNELNLVNWFSRNFHSNRMDAIEFAFNFAWYTSEVKTRWKHNELWAMSEKRV